MIMVNLGCGTCYHAEWINLDSVPCGPGVRACDVRGALPFADASVDVVYHSHVLEHLTAAEGKAFIRECARVLRPGGIIRVVVPDLEGIARAYLAALEEAAAGGDATLHTWTRMELTDQAARSTPGGEMLAWARSLGPAQIALVRRRAGRELDAILKPGEQLPRWRRVTPGRIWRKLRRTILYGFVGVLGGRRMKAALAEGSFRQSGEVHRLMYDRVALARLLTDCGLAEASVVAAIQSRIPDFGRFGLDAVDGETRKPDSLFMEAVRP